MLLNGLATPKIAPSSWDFVTMLEQERATAIGNMHRKIGKDHVCGSGDMFADRQTHRHRDRCAHYKTSPLLPRGIGKVNMKKVLQNALTNITKLLTTCLFCVKMSHATRLE